MHKNFNSNESGAAMVEFALVLPLLLLLVLGIFTFGRVINYWIDETHLTSEAARFAAVNRNPGPAATLQESIRGQADTRELREGGTSSVASRAELCIDFPNVTSNVGDPVRATMTVDFKLIPLVDVAGLGTITLKGSATHRLEAKLDPADATSVKAGCSSP